MTEKPVWAAVLPSAPAEYSQQWTARLVDIVHKLIEQINEPRQLTAATAVFSDLPHESPRYGTEGEVFTKVCANCSATVLAINQNIAEGRQHAQTRRTRSRIEKATDLSHIDDQPSQTDPARAKS